MKTQVPLAAVLGIGVLIVAVAGYLALVKSQQTKVSDLEAEIATLQSELEIAEQQRAQQIAAAAAGIEEESEIEVADLVRLSKAMPDEDDIAATLVELDSVSAAAGVEFVSIQPLPPVDAGPGYSRVPIQTDVLRQLLRSHERAL